MDTSRDGALLTAEPSARPRTARRRLPAQRTGTLSAAPTLASTGAASSAAARPAATGDRAGRPARRAPRPSLLLDAYCVVLGAAVLAGSAVAAPFGRPAPRG